MKCYCYETCFVFSVEDSENENEENFLYTWYKKTDNRFLKIYPKNMEDGGVYQRAN